MSGSTEKATRREIRRALGSEGLEVVNGATQVLSHVVVPQLKHHDDLFASVGRELDWLQRAYTAAGLRLDKLEAPTTFWGRLTWLVTGR